MNRLEPAELASFLRKYRFAGGRLRRVRLRAGRGGTLSVELLLAVQTALRDLGTDSDEVIANRMARSATEISHWAEYDYVLINNDADKCCELVHNILKAERLKATRRVFLHDFVRSLIG